MMELEKLPNIGKILAQELIDAGIGSEEALRKIGSVQALLKVNGLAFREACLNKLYAFEGAIQGIRWHDLPRQAKDQVRARYYEAIGR